MRRSVEDGLSLLVGAGIGVAAMYLLDPECGQKRRRAVGEAMRGTGEALGHAWEGVVDNAQELSHSVADQTRGLRKSLVAGTAAMVPSAYRTRKGLRGYAHRIGDTGRSFFSRASDIGHDVGDRARHYTSRGVNWFREDHSDSHILGHTVGALGALALGAALVYLFDPNSGRGRRAWIGQKATAWRNDASDTMRRTGRHLRNRAQGMAAEARAAVSRDHATDDQLRERIRSEMGRSISTPGTVDVIVRQGHVTLCGTLPPSEHQSLLSAVLDVRGVVDVDNQLRSPEAGAAAGMSQPSSGMTGPMLH